MISELSYYESYRSFERKKSKGTLKNLSKVQVTEKANVSFSVDVIAIAQGPLVGILKPRMILGVVTDEARQEQAFIIKKIDIRLNGEVEIYAEHVVMALCDVSVGFGRLKSNTAAGALTQWEKLLLRSNDNSEIISRYQTKSNIPFGLELESMVTPELFPNAFQLLMGARGSILDTWGGEYRFNNTTIELLEKRGNLSKIPMRQGENILDFSYEETSLDNYDSMSGYAKVDRDGIPEIYFGKVNPYVVSTKGHDIYQTLSMDFTDSIPEKVLNDVSKNALDPYAKQKLIAEIDKLNVSYVKSNKERFLLEDKENLKIVPNYSSYMNLDILKEWQVFNTLEIELPIIGYKGQAKIVETKIDLLSDKLESITLGKPKRMII